MMISCFFSTRIKGSVTPLMKGKETKELRDMVGSTSLKNIPTNSSGRRNCGSLGYKIIITLLTIVLCQEANA